jgi:hypothetical protein
VLLTADAAAYSAVVRRRWKTTAIAALVCFSVAAVIEVIEYRLLVIAIVVVVPAVIPMIEAIFFARWARDLHGAVAVRLDGDRLTLREGLTLDVRKLVNLRVQPDVLILSERYGPGPRSVRAYLVPAAGEKAQAFVARLAALGVKVVHEKATVVTVAAFLWGVMANLLLQVVASVLVLGAVVTAAKNLIEGKGPGWDAAAYLGGALLALTAYAVIELFLKSAAKP